MIPINGAMTISEIAEIFPGALQILMEWGLGCAHCHIGEVETLEEGALAHGFDEEEIAALLDELNAAAQCAAEENKEEASF